ncbi:phosphatase [Candidatus Contubernalis alkaliaceticus]|uniref:phosphatase n=1 Tax=Candidatus Contubernalis alkaliaceticus TaxID=338645 RepID=UPI001F4C436C|nr:phosphatase [Candidatus Contubernalis alkalaceticus]UNC90786.1 phosphatase [Candidatus Contubernalis alkalaceticus]
MRLVADLHTHSIASGHAYSTINEIAEAAARKGLSMVAITDHGPAMPGGPHAYYFGNLHVLPEEICGIEVLKGIEANIIDHQGNIDLSAEYLKKLDIVLAGFHAICYPGGSKEQNTRAMIKVMENPQVDIIVHPGNPNYPIDEYQVVEAAIKHNTMIEINNSSLTVSRKGSCENCQRIAQVAKEMGAKIVIGSDAHTSCHVGNFSTSLEMIMEAGFTEEKVLNSSLDKIKEYLGEKGRKRFVDG